MTEIFKDQVVWVVGGTGAIGQAVAAEMTRLGAVVVVSGRRSSPPADSALPSSALYVPVDVAQRDSVDGAVAEILQRVGRIDMLVNTTSVSIFGDFLELTDEEWMAVYQHKLFGYLRTIRAVIPLMQEQRGGRIVNVSGRGGHQPTLPVHLPGMSANASVNLLTKGLANMYGSFGIRINAVAPGPVQSERYAAIEAATTKLGAGGSHPSSSAFNTATANGRKVTAQEVANTIIFLLREESSCLNGTLLQADGGSTAGL